MGVRLPIFVAVAAIGLTACFGGDGDEPGAVVGAWPASIEREFVDEAVGSGFFDAFAAQCLLEFVQREVTLEEFQQFQREEAEGMQNSRYADIFEEALFQCTILRKKEQTNHGYADPPSPPVVSLERAALGSGGPAGAGDVA